MTFRFFDAPEREPSRSLAFAGNRIERQSEHRSDDCVEKALAEPSARLLVVRDGRTLIRLQGETFDPWFSVGELGGIASSMEQAILLGRDDKGPVLAVPGDFDAERLPETIKAIEHRSIYIQGLVDEAALGALAQAAALLGWNASHRFCGRCGSRTAMRAGGYRRHCHSCGADHFPRTDPVAIMLTATKEKCLLGRGRHFTPGSYSALAGFIEPGETIEDAVRRETLEEAGIRLGRVVYYASQPWPFPYSLMIGCYGEPLNDDIHTDSSELEDCRWFSRDEVRLMLAREHPQGLTIPPKGAIAHQLVSAWAEGD
jgi:NAD+ diphosphatase